MTASGDAEIIKPGVSWCEIDIHPNLFDLKGTMTTSFYNKSDMKEPTGFIHADQTLVVKTRVSLSGRILSYLCKTQLCVCASFESCGKGIEDDFCDWKTLEDPCKIKDYDFEIEVPANKLTSGHCGKDYTVCVVLGSKDCCGKVGFIFGRCRHFSITVLPADESGLPA